MLRSFKYLCECKVSRFAYAHQLGDVWPSVQSLGCSFRLLGFDFGCCHLMPMLGDCGKLVELSKPQRPQLINGNK